MTPALVRRRTGALPAAVASLLLVTAAGRSARAAAPPSATDDDADVEVEAPATTSPAVPEPATTRPPERTAPAPVTPPPEPAASAPATVRAPAPAPARPEPTTLAGVRIEAPGGRASALSPRSLVAEGANDVRPIRRGFAVWGFVQAQYVRNALSEDELDPSGDPLNYDQFSLRRGRLRLDHGWEYAAATLELDASTVNGPIVGVRRAEASLLYRGTDDDGVTPLVVLTGGVTDVPFGAEIGESQRDRVFMERSVGSLALFPTEQDIGLKVWGAKGFLTYGLAVVNGQPVGPHGFARDPNAAKDVVGRIGAHAHANERLDVTGGLSFWNGKGFSPGRIATKDSITWVDDNNNGFAEAYELQGVTGSAAVPSQSFARWAYGLDVGAALRTPIGLTRATAEAVLAQNMDRGLLVSDPVTTGANARQLVLALTVVQQVTDYGFVGFRGAYYDPNADVLEQRAGVFHLKDESYVVLSPVVGATLGHARLVGQYDVVSDRLARDIQGVPTNAKNDQLTLRLQVDL